MKALDGFSGALLAATIAFVATNLDDLLVLTVFFAQSDGVHFKPWHVVVGQYMGFTVLVGISMVGFAGSAFVPQQWLGILGILPIGIGLWKLFVLFRGEKNDDDDNEQKNVDQDNVESDSNRKEEHSLPAEESQEDVEDVERETLIPRKQAEPQAQAPSCWTRFKNVLEKIFNPHIVMVGLVTIANGGDNIAIYVPLFASADPGQVIIIVVVFYTMVAIWCFVSAALIQCQFVASALSRYGAYIIPIALIGLGFYIFYSAALI